jgi:hypothetical protein
MKHLTPEEFVDALEGTLTPERAGHLDACASCRTDVEGLRALVGDAQRDAEADAAEPSPLFWPHFAARVRAATEAQPVSGGGRWWTPRWHYAVAAASMLTLAITGAWLTRLASVPLPASTGQIAAGPEAPGPRPLPDDPRAAIVDVDTSSARGGGADEPADSEGWSRVVQLTGTLPADDRLTVVPATAGSAGLIEDLSPSQLREFVRLLRAEQGGMQ